MKESAILFYLPGDMYPSLGNTHTSRIEISQSDRVTGDVHISLAYREQVIKDLRKLADELETITPPKILEQK